MITSEFVEKQFADWITTSSSLQNQEPNAKKFTDSEFFQVPFNENRICEHGEKGKWKKDDKGHTSKDFDKKMPRSAWTWSANLTNKWWKSSNLLNSFSKKHVE